MTTTLTFDHTPKLLALRRSGTVDVALFWSRRRHRAAVAVEDEATGERFELPVEPGDNPLDLFEHPYAYAFARHAIG
ncbi:MAG TPA: hypothetical protein VI408_01425 [Gaiellaceae bacterium]